MRNVDEVSRFARNALVLSRLEVAVVVYRVVSDFVWVVSVEVDVGE